jgi:ribosomal protein S18 acetylase RimI-like enzyme
MNIRLYSKTDSIEELTDLIHKAYRQLAELGYRYWATHQSVEDTIKRIKNSECYLALKNKKVVGTVTLNFPDKAYSHSWYDRTEVTTFNQLAVDPNYQRQGIASILLSYIEKRAFEMGAKELSCDTASEATHLIDMYKNRGYREVGEVDWKQTNYTSVILSKLLKA